MTPTASPDPASLRKGDSLHGFTLKERRDLSGMRAVGTLWICDSTGAEVLHVACEDPENLLSLGFRTPPPDSTGLPHILEHSVLCGSKRFPVKDPFVELLKTSLATFLNAMTYPDKTVYPCASMVENDFFNLAKVYCDAVFHPLIREEHFRQEGHHYDFATPGDTESALTIKGIVYNEMKGVYSDLDSIMDRHASASLFPENAYGRDYGGDPAAIPDLTYEDFVAFHLRYYHPSNARIFLYGSIPVEKHLAFLRAEALAGFERLGIDTTIDEQSRFDAPVREVVPYPVGADEETTGKTAHLLTWRACSATEGVKVLAMLLLDTILLDNAASPLRKALVDSKLGEDVIGGYEDHVRDTTFTVGLKGSEPDRADKVAAVVRETCERLVRDGIDDALVARALHQLQLASRETSGEYPLHLMDRVYRTWMYDADPFANLRLDEQLTRLDETIRSSDRYLEGLLRETILDNPHAAVLSFVPDPALARTREAAFAERMQSVKDGFSRDELQGIDREARRLELLQAEPNTEANLATLPRLHRDDIPVEPIDLPTVRDAVAGRDLLYTDVFANGLSYLKLAIDLTGLPDELIDDLPLYADCLRKMGADEETYLQLAEREADCSGGIGIDLNLSGHAEDPARVQPLLLLHIRGVDAKLPEMLDLLRTRLVRTDFSDRERLRDVVLQGRVSRRRSIIPAGHRFAASGAARHLGRNGELSERTTGASQVRRYDRYANAFDSEIGAAVERLERIREFVLNREATTFSYVGASANLPTLKDGLAALVDDLGHRPLETPRSGAREPAGQRDGIATPSEVNFVAQALPVPGYLDPASPALLLLGVHLSFGYLWEEVRVKRGAYGGMASYSSLDGLLALASYRDPFINETLSTYAGVGEFVETRMDLSLAALEQSIIGAVKLLDRPVRPGQACSSALMRHLRGITKERRRAYRERLLALRPETIRESATAFLRNALASAPICVLAGRERLEAAGSAPDGAPFEIEAL